MKFQCSCGAKYAFDVTPEMLANPVKFVCPGCGADSSEAVNQLIRLELGGQDSAPAAGPAAGGLKISHSTAPAAAAPAPELTEVGKFCPKHIREKTTERCAICQKPICPKCLELFGYFCSPLCQAKAEAQALDVPVYAGRRDVVQAQFWRHTGLIFGSLALVVALALGVWIWYAWFGSVPHPYFALRFAETERGYSGRAELAGKEQVVFLHGGTLARYDLKTKRPVWSQELVTKQQIADLAKAESELENRLNNGSSFTHRRTGDAIEKSIRQMLEAGLQLHLSGQNIWVAQGNRLKHYDWDSGQVTREIKLPERAGELVETAGELLLLGEQSATHINLASGDTRTEQFGDPGTPLLAATPTGGLAPADSGKALDPQQVEARVQNLKLPGRLALPALIAGASHERQLEAALRDDPQHPRAQAAPPRSRDSYQLVPGKTGFMQLSTRLLEERLVTHSAMKAAPAKSVLNGDLNANQTTAVANEMLNEMQRNAGGDTVMEDESRYQVTVHQPEASGPADWVGEVVGPPQLFVLKTVNVIAAGKSVIVLDKSNHKLWQATLTYPVPPASGEFFSGESQFGEGPCVEHGDTLYVFDQAVLSAYELNSGNARWRLPSVGTVGLFFDDQNCVYVNTTSGNPDDIKYSRQIDVSRKTESVLFKLEPKTGKTLWSIRPDGYVSYLSGKFIYTIQSYDPDPLDEEDYNDLTSGLQKPPFLRITRIRPSDGRILWFHEEERCPVAWHFNKNNIELVFKREVEVLRYLTF